jgi:hypothetical protein
MAVSDAVIDYYAVLQVHPDADFEVIEAAYRQLMKKHHPDLAGDDRARAAIHHARSKAITEAFRVLRDPEQRRHYDAIRQLSGTHRPPDARPSEPRRAPSRPPVQPPPSLEPFDYEQPERDSALPGPIALLVGAYNLMPGPYEWEDGGGVELRSVLLMPVLGVAGYALASGRLSAWIGHSLQSTLVAWVLLALCTLPLWRAALRIAIAVVPTVALVSGVLDPALQQAHVPIWLAWVFFSVLSLILAARLYVFSVLPTLALCWLIARIG